MPEYKEKRSKLTSMFPSLFRRYDSSDVEGDVDDEDDQDAGKGKKAAAAGTCLFFPFPLLLIATESSH
jgi:hypothetical protein